jgi:hypothetical protein
VIERSKSLIECEIQSAFRRSGAVRAASPVTCSGAAAVTVMAWGSTGDDLHTSGPMVETQGGGDFLRSVGGAGVDDDGLV